MEAKKVTVTGYGYTVEDLKKRIPLEIADEEAYFSFLREVTEKYPFIAVMGLRVLMEMRLKDFLRRKDIKFRDKATVNELISKLPPSVPDAQKWHLGHFAEFENIGSHGYVIEKNTALWALEAIPAFLMTIK
jgi:hypothetical protein